MKIIFAIEYFIPFAIGGSEWSTYYLAKDLVSLGHEVVIITPNFGSKNKELNEGVKILRFPFFKKIKRRQMPGNFLFTNPFSIIWSAVFYYFLIKKEKADIIHIQGKYSIAPVRIANLLLRLPALATIRDYQPICNYGLCLYKSTKACSIKKYFTQDFPQYYKTYIPNKNWTNFLLNLCFSIWGRISKNILKLFSQDLLVVVLSNAQKNIFLANGYKNLTVIGNSTPFLKNNVKGKENNIIYAGRLTPGKGVVELLKTLPNFLEEFPDYQFIFVGEGLLKNDLEKIAKRQKRILVKGQLSHYRLQKLISKSKVVLVPSIWPEPFGRIAIESLAQKTPVIASNRGALPEIVNKRWGIITEPSNENLLKAVRFLIKNNDSYIRNIESDFKKIEKKFKHDITSNYLSLYNNLLK